MPIGDKSEDKKHKSARAIEQVRQVRYDDYIKHGKSNVKPWNGLADSPYGVKKK